MVTSTQLFTAADTITAAAMATNQLASVTADKVLRDLSPSSPFGSTDSL